MLDKVTILDKYGVADYRLYYAADRVPQVDSNGCYCLETNDARLLEDRRGNILIFPSLREAVAVRQLAGLHTPILAFFDTPLPDGAAPNEPVSFGPEPETSMAGEEMDDLLAGLGV